MKSFSQLSIWLKDILTKWAAGILISLTLAAVWAIIDYFGRFSSLPEKVEYQMTEIIKLEKRVHDLDSINVYQQSWINFFYGEYIKHSTNNQNP